jgi:hypothetical protein
MDGGQLNQTVRTTHIYSMPTPTSAPARRGRTLSSGFWPIVLFSALGLAAAFGLSHGTLCTGVDINAGCVPADWAP